MILLRGTSKSGSLPVDGPGVSAIVDHAFVPRGEWWTVCGHVYDDGARQQWGLAPSYPCGLAEAAHATTTVRRDNPT